MHVCNAKRITKSLTLAVRPSQYAPQLPEHGYVRVTYQAALDDPENMVEAPHKRWHPLTPDGSGGLMTDPKGVIFMEPGVVMDLSVPAKVETWKHGDIGDAEGLQKKDVWRKRRVMRDILDHRMVSFTKEQKDQWRALNEFHERYTCSDQVPNSPLTLRAGTMIYQTLIDGFL